MSILNPDEILNVSEITDQDVIDGLQIQLIELTYAYEEIKKQNNLNKGALAELIARCKHGGFNPFAAEGVILTNNPYHMTPEQIIERNKIVSEKHANTRATSDDTAPFLNVEEQIDKIYANRKDKGEKEAINSVLKHTVRTWLEQAEQDELESQEVPVHEDLRRT